MSVRPSVRPSIYPSVRPSVHRPVRPSFPCYFQTRTRRILCRVSGLILLSFFHSTTHLYKSSYPSIRRSVIPSVAPSVAPSVRRLSIKVVASDVPPQYLFLIHPSPSGNTMTGKLHMNLQNYSKIKITTSMDELMKAVDNINFLEIKPLSANACLVISDGIVIKKHNNIPAVSARVYSQSKLLMWHVWFQIAARMSYFSGNGACRLILTDTDSLYQAVERDRSLIEQYEIMSLQKNETQVSYFETFTSRRLVEAYIKTVGHFLDFSSITKVMVIILYQTILFLMKK